jgi:hypothetical protein
LCSGTACPFPPIAWPLRNWWMQPCRFPPIILYMEIYG